MKGTAISMIVVLCVLAVIPMLFMGDRSLLANFGLEPFTGKKEEPKLPKNLTNVKTDKKVQVYKWRDEHGVMQFTNTPPPESRQAELVELRPDTNIVKAIEMPEEETENKRSGPKVMTVGNPYTPGGMKDLLDTTSSLAEDMSEQQMKQQQLVNEILGIKNEK